jgi:hypothetical protein
VNQVRRNRYALKKKAEGKRNEQTSQSVEQASQPVEQASQPVEQASQLVEEALIQTPIYNSG